MVFSIRNYFNYINSSYLALYFSDVSEHKEKIYISSCLVDSALIKEHSKIVLNRFLHFMASQNIKRLFCQKSKIIVSEKKTGKKLILKSKI